MKKMIYFCKKKSRIDLHLHSKFDSTLGSPSFITLSPFGKVGIGPDLGRPLHKIK